MSADDFERVYAELRRLAAAKLRAEPAGHTLDATALVHEAYLKLGGADFDAPAGYFRAAAVAMQRVLVDHARRKRAAKRTPDVVPSGDASLADPDRVIDLADAVDRLAAEDADLAELARLRLFAGLGLDDAAGLLGVSRATAYRDWAYVRAWLTDALRGPDPSEPVASAG